LKLLERIRVAFDLDRHAAGMVDHEAGEIVSRRKAVDERTKPHTLHDSTHVDGTPLHLSPIIALTPHPRRNSKPIALRYDAL